MEKGTLKTIAGGKWKKNTPLNKRTDIGKGKYFMLKIVSAQKT